MHVVDYFDANALVGIDTPHTEAWILDLSDDMTDFTHDTGIKIKQDR